MAIAQQHEGEDRRAGALQVGALLLANVSLALGPWLVRLADTGPVSSAFWRIALALPILFLFSAREGALPWTFGKAAIWAVSLAGLAFGLDLASWHLGIERTRLGNASLFGNAGSVILMAWGLIAAQRRPRLFELVAVVAAISGAALLMGGSLSISVDSFVGDLLCLAAGMFYAVYILALRPVRAKFGSWSVLAGSSLASAPVLLLIALLLRESVWPGDWTPLVALMLGSQVIGQGLLIYSLRFFSPLVIGLALLTQPAVAAASGWLAFGETLSASDIFGMVLLAASLVIVRARE
ncbi:MAG: DMT family transporter [Sphingomonadaceae bacterium]